MPRRVGIDYLNEKDGYGLFLKVKGTKIPKMVFNSALASDVVRYIVQNLDPQDEIYIPELICYSMNIESNWENEVLDRIRKKYPDNFDQKSEMVQLWEVEKHINNIISDLAGRGDLRITVNELSNATSSKAQNEMIEDMMRKLFDFPKDDDKKGEN